eukprot:11009722-Alexandrium_andersonii.AAC.1
MAKKTSEGGVQRQPEPNKVRSQPGCSLIPIGKHSSAKQALTLFLTVVEQDLYAKSLRAQ